MSSAPRCSASGPPRIGGGSLVENAIRRRPGARRDRRRERLAVAGGVDEQRGVGDAADDRAEDRQAVPGLVLGRERDPAALGLEAEEPAAAGRDADRAAAVGAQRAAREAGRDRRRRAAAGAARRAVEVPRVAGHPERRRLGEGRDLELGDAGLADDHRAGRAQAAHDLRVGGRGVAEGVRAARGHLARDVGVVLDRHRHAQQRAAIAAAAAAVGLGGLGERALAEHDAERVEGRVEARDALQVGLGELARGDAPPRRSARPGARGRRRRGRWLQSRRRRLSGVG